MESAVTVDIDPTDDKAADLARDPKYKRRNIMGKEIHIGPPQFVGRDIVNPADYLLLSLDPSQATPTINCTRAGERWVAFKPNLEARQAPGATSSAVTKPLDSILDAERFTEDREAMAAGATMRSSAQRGRGGSKLMKMLDKKADKDEEANPMSDVMFRKGKKSKSGGDKSGVSKSGGVEESGDATSSAQAELMADSVYSDAPLAAMSEGGDDMIMGGGNDAEFSSRGVRFSAFSDGVGGDETTDGKGVKSKIFGGCDTHQQSDETRANRDTKYLYDEIDFDADAELFDNEDVGQEDNEELDLEDADVNNALNQGDEEEEYDDDDVDMDDEAKVKERAAFGTKKGLMLMNKKAEGEEVDIDEITGKKKGSKTAYDKDLDAPVENSKKRGHDDGDEPGSKKLRIEEDKKGRRVLDKDSVRKQLWLNNGKIMMRELIKIFSISKKDAARTKMFLEIVEELCVKQPNGELVLKQHYRN